ncbi:MAG: UDP-N-acetylmuramate dehydrogenase [Candidatus Subteraquimicrobiales bacterium]|nr:UDP-N-acetylmuramate dehydrogenase [Candidatus Subteraquimicrobiales bacterium]
MAAVDRAYSRLSRGLRERAVKNFSLSRKTTLQVGGPAKAFVVVDSLEELRWVMQTIHDFGVSFFVIGRGSNLLVSDNGFKGVVIELGTGFRKIHTDGIYVQAGAATLLPALVQLAWKEGLSGLTFAVGIPGGLGGALTLNAGAYSKAIGDIVTSATLYTPDCQLVAFDRSELVFDYRYSSLAGQGIILEAVLKFKKGSAESIQAEMERNFKKRKKTQPLQLPSAGSVFKNPTGLSAGKLIEEAGLRGLQIGEAQISVKHCNFVVNLGNASGQDIYNLLRLVQKKVFDTQGVLLEPEITLVGEFEEELITSDSE